MMAFPLEKVHTSSVWQHQGIILPSFFLHPTLHRVVSPPCLPPPEGPLRRIPANAAEFLQGDGSGPILVAFRMPSIQKTTMGRIPGEHPSHCFPNVPKLPRPAYRGNSWKNPKPGKFPRKSGRKPTLVDPSHRWNSSVLPASEETCLAKTSFAQASRCW